MSKIGLIIEREYLSRVKKKSFLILTILTPILIIALIAIPLLLSMVKDSSVKQIAVADYSGNYYKRLQSSKQYQFVRTDKKLAAFHKTSINNKDIYALLVIKGDLSTDTGKVVLYSKKQIEMDLKDFISDQLKTMARNDKVASFHIPNLDKIIKESDPAISISTIKWNEDGSEKESSSELAMIIGMICTMAIYIFIFAYGAMVMNGVIEEKTNRIVEIIVSSVKPFELMMGKIIGIAMVGLTQVMLWVIILAGGIGIAGAFLSDSLTPGKIASISTEMAGTQSINGQMQLSNTANLTSMAGTDQTDNPQIAEMLQMLHSMNMTELVICFILFFLGGYLLYASLFAAVGSAIDSQEDAQQFTLPLTIPVLFALYAGIYSASNPDGPLAFWCSLIPFTSPIVMMVRIPFGVPFWQLALSFGLLVITFVLTTAFASKIYRTGILMYGKKATYKELWKWLTYKS